MPIAVNLMDSNFQAILNNKLGSQNHTTIVIYVITLFWTFCRLHAKTVLQVTSQRAFFTNLQLAIIGPSATLTGR